MTEAHQQQFNDSYNVLMGHSAGTEAVRVAQRVEGANTPTLFNLSIAASPRQLDGFADGTMMIVADGDFWYSSNGNIRSRTVFSTMSENDAIELAKHYTVLRIADNQSPGSIIARAATMTTFPVAADFMMRLEKHRNTHELSGPVRTVVLYPQHGSDHVNIHTTSLGGLVSQITEHPLLLNGSAEQRLAEAENIRRERAWIEPTPGIGGVSLSAVADTPFDAGDVEGAAFDANGHQVVLTMLDGRRSIIALPNLSLDGLGACYRAVYINDAKPELSIGARPPSLDKGEDNQARQHASGRQPVFYLGGTRSTDLGLALLRADKALGDLAFGSTATVRDVATRVEGFHSVAEMFLEKYADHPVQDDYLGAITIYANAERVDVVPTTSLWSRIWSGFWSFWSGANSGSNFELGPPVFAVRFGQNAGPAETAFATFFTLH